MNIFSGARRIAAIFAGLSIIVMVFQLITEEPNVVLNYRVPSIDAPALPTDECYVGIDAVEHIKRITPSGKTFYVKLCFAATEAENGKFLIPFAQTEDGVKLNHLNTAGVREYTYAYGERVFTLTEEHYDLVEEKYRSQWWVDKAKRVGGTVVWLFVLWICVWAIGWIVRGFMGVPKGQDYRAVSVEQQK